jgi:hypothetical protein
MDIKYTWKILKLSVIQSPDKNFVTEAHWICSGTDGTHSAEIDGETKFSRQENQKVVPYKSLTEDIVFGWIQSTMGGAEVSQTMENFEACVAGQINSLKTPPETITKESPPWE